MPGRSMILPLMGMAALAATPISAQMLGGATRGTTGATVGTTGALGQATGGLSTDTPGAIDSTTPRVGTREAVDSSSRSTLRASRHRSTIAGDTRTQVGTGTSIGRTGTGTDTSIGVATTPGSVDASTNTGVTQRPPR